MKKLVGIAALSAVLSLTIPENKATNKYPLPEAIHAQNYSTVRAKFEQPHTLEQIIQTKDIDFSKPFDLQTDRYRLIQDHDAGISEYIGKVGSLITKLLFFDSRIGESPDSERAKAVLSMLESRTDIKNITVRLGHNRVGYDLWRLFADEKIKQRNNIFARIGLGLPSMLLSESYAELMRGDYYNPLTQTAVVYSNIESIAAHEIGHGIDYHRFSRDWAYSLATAFPPARLYKEYAASKNAATLLAPQDQQQVPRFLLPAYLTYLAAGWALSRKILQQRQIRYNNGAIPKNPLSRTFEVVHFLDDQFNGVDLDKIPEEQHPKVRTREVARYFAHQTLMLAGAAAAYSSASAAGPLVASTAFATGMVATDLLCDIVGDHLAPYEYERPRMMTRRAVVLAYRTGKHLTDKALHWLHHASARGARALPQ